MYLLTQKRILAVLVGLFASAFYSPSVWADPKSPDSELGEKVLDLRDQLLDLDVSNKFKSITWSFRDESGRVVTVDVIRSHNKSEHEKAIRLLAVPPPGSTNTDIEVLYALDKDSIKNYDVNEFITRWNTEGVSGVQQITIDKKTQNALKSKGFSKTHELALKYNQGVLTALRITGYLGITTYIFSQTMPLVPAVFGGIIASSVGGALTYYIDNFNDWIKYKGWNSFDKSKVGRDRNGKHLKASLQEIMAKWCFIQFSVLGVMEVTKHTFANSLYPEMYSSGVLKSTVDIATISLLAFLQQGVWEMVLSDIFKDKEAKAVEVYEKMNPKMYVNQGELFQGLQKQLKTTSMQARIYGFGLAYFSIYFASTAMSSDPTETLRNMAAFGAPGLGIYMYRRRAAIEKAAISFSEKVTTSILGYNHQTYVPRACMSIFASR